MEVELTAAQEVEFAMEGEDTNPPDSVATNSMSEPSSQSDFDYENENEEEGGEEGEIKNNDPEVSFSNNNSSRDGMEHRTNN